MADPAIFIGIDVGTTAVKAGLFTRDGTMLSHFSRRYPTERPGPGLVEQNPRHWINGIRDALDHVLAGHAPRDVGAVGLCSQVNTDVFVDENGVPLAPAISWQDVRAADAAVAIDASITPEEKLAWWGAPMPIGASHVLAKMRWMAQHRPEIWARTRHVLSPKDYCLLHLTGAIATDPIASFGQIGLDTRYIAPLIAKVPGAAERLPPLKSFDTVVGEVKLGAGGHAVPVVTGTMDAWGSLFGCGVCRPGEGMYVSGTSEILALVADRRIGAPGVVTFPEVSGLVVNAGPTQSGGDSLRWLGPILGHDPLDIPQLAESADRGGVPILFLPHLEGERAPLWDSDLRGAFVGLDSRTGPAEIALAVLEGVALSADMLLDALAQAAGFRPQRLRYGGGGAKSDLWSQIRADCLGLPLDRSAVADAGCLGAAIMAAVGVGAFANVADAAALMSKVDRTFEPDPKRKARYDALREAYRGATAALRPLGRFHAG